MRYPDGELEPTLELRKALVREMRRLKADVVLCQDPRSIVDDDGTYLNHPDHRAAGQAALDAAFPAAGNPSAFRDLLAEGLEAHKVREVFMSTQQSPDVWIDITGCFERKLLGLKEHTSQVGERWEQVVERIKERSRALTKAQGLPFEFAEGYKYFKLD